MNLIFYRLKNKQAPSGGGKNMISIIKCFINPMVVDHKSITMMDTQLNDYITSFRRYENNNNFQNAEACDVIRR